jgi:hypothetical protein
MIKQLNPTIPVETPKGSGMAHFLIDYGQEQDLQWVTFIDETGECWVFNNPDIRIQHNITMGRPKQEHKWRSQWRKEDMGKELVERLRKDLERAIQDSQTEAPKSKMHLSEIRLTFDTLEKAMGLPPDAKVVAVQEEDIKGVLKFRIVSLREPPEEYSFNQLSTVGEGYCNPEKYKAKPLSKRGIHMQSSSDHTVE